MTLYIFTTHKDLSLPLILEGADKLKVKVKTVFFSDLQLQKDEIFISDHLLILDKKDKIIIRWPWDAETLIDFNYWVKILLLKYPDNIALDKKTLMFFTPFYEDKLFQSQIFDQLKLPTPATYFFQTKKQLMMQKLRFPLIAKKRISSRSKGNFLVNSTEEAMEKSHNKINRYILQEKKTFETDIRINILKGQVVGAVTRQASIRKNNRLSVKVNNLFKIENKKILQQSLELAHFLGADFLGIDVILTSSGEYYFLEANLSPQFNRFKEFSGIDLGKLLVMAAVK